MTEEGVRAVLFRQFGPPPVLEVAQVGFPAMGPGEVLLRVLAAAINPTDALLRRGLKPSAGPPPHVPGMEVAGILKGLGPGVTRELSGGDPVMGLVVPSGLHGGYSEWIVLPQDSVVAAPEGTTHVEASTIPMSGLTARLALDLLGLVPGQTLAVTGAAGVVGGYVVQMARHEGLRVLADAAPDDEARVAGLGADVVVQRGDDTAARVRVAVPGGVDAVVDAAVQHHATLGAIRDGGALVSLRDGLHESEMPRGIKLHRVRVRDHARSRARLETLRRLVECGRLTPQVERPVSPNGVVDAHRCLEAGGLRGRLVVDFRHDRTP